MAKRKAKKWNLNSRVRSALRKAWLYSPMRREALANARGSYGRYKCAICGDTFGRKDVNVDHITPCVGPEGIVSWHVFILRLFCPPEGLRVLCEPDHHIITQKQREEKKKWKKENA